MISAYLRRTPISRANARRCYYCDCFLVPATCAGSPEPNIRTRDHVHIASRGGYRGWMHTGGKIENFRFCCARCNNLRSSLGHCCGLLMMALLEADHTREPLEAVCRYLNPVQVSRAQKRTQRGFARLLVRQAMRYGV